MRIACGSEESERPLSRFPRGGKAGAGGFPHAAGTLRASQKRCHASMPRLPPQEGLPPPCASPAAFQRGCTLHGKPDISLANKTGQLNVLPTARMTSPLRHDWRCTQPGRVNAVRLVMSVCRSGR
jgi:hypothetical protein